MTLQELTKGIHIIAHANIQQDMEITGIAYDSRKVKPGNAFVCIEGFQTDGHQYIDGAIQNGAQLIVCQHLPKNQDIPYLLVENSRHALAVLSANYYENPSRKFQLIGVTGTNGKTSTTYMLKAILEQANKKVGLIGTNQNMIGKEVIHTERTTPESLELQQLFYEMAKKGVDAVIMEVSSHSLALSRVDGCEFDVGLFTNLTQDHLDFHKDMQDYLNAKKKLFAMSKFAVLNRDDAVYNELRNSIDTQVFTYSIEHNDADAIAKNIRQNNHGVEFEVLLNNQIGRISLNIPGKFSIYNSLGAMLVATQYGISMNVIQQALKEFIGVKGRAELVQIPTDFSVMIDYAHTPDGLVNILNTINSYKTGRVITLFGCGGDRDAKKRPIMGAVATQLSDFCIVTSDNPRSENSLKIIDDITAGIQKDACPYIVIENRKEAIEYGLAMAEKDDVLLLAGKGHETYQIQKEQTIHFDEREIVKQWYEKQH